MFPRCGVFTMFRTVFQKYLSSPGFRGSIAAQGCMLFCIVLVFQAEQCFLIHLDVILQKVRIDTCHISLDCRPALGSSRCSESPG